MTWVSFADHGNATLVQEVAVYQNTDANERVKVCKVKSDSFGRGVEQSERERSEEYGEIQPRDPGSFVGEPDFALDLDGRRDLLRDSDLNEGIDGVVVSHDRGRFVVAVSGVGDAVLASVALRPLGAPREIFKRGGRERGEDVPWCTASYFVCPASDGVSILFVLICGFCGLILACHRARRCPVLAVHKLAGGGGS